MKPKLPRHFVVRPIDAGRAEQSYALARLAAPALSLEEWRDLIAALRGGVNCVRARHEILVIETGDGYVHALCSVQPAIDLAQGLSTLSADLVVADFLNARPLAAALLGVLRNRAMDAGCSAIQIHLPGRPASEEPEACGIAAALRDAGFRAGPTLERWTLQLGAEPAEAQRKAAS